LDSSEVEESVSAVTLPVTKVELEDKWQMRFRPDWPWNIPGVTSLFLSIKQLRAIEAEIAAEQAAGAPNLYPSRPYTATMPNQEQGYLFFRKAENGYPEATEHYLHEEGSEKTQQIILRLEGQRAKGWVREDW
jgi:hypothetical protein